jgi:flagellar biosynthesis chaperone FliJ
MAGRRFRFTLQKVLDLRLWDEKQAENLLSAKTGQCSVCQQAIEELYLRRRDKFLGRASGGLDLTVLAVHDAFRLRLQALEFRQAETKRETLRLDDLNTAAFIRKMRPLEEQIG